MNKGIIALAVCAALMSGCAKSVWMNPSVTQEQSQKDFAECQYDVVKHTPSYYGMGDPIASGIASGMRQNEIMSACMSSKGYHLEARQKLTEQTTTPRPTVNSNQKTAFEWSSDIDPMTGVKR
ncbi:MAG: hypothetical protein WC856_13960 [Methylococcaceae bacterium]|jgi:hypothetical protein